MGIFVSIEDTEGEPLSEAIDIERLQRHFPAQEGFCLRFISEAEDAFFNQGQLPYLLAELKTLEEKLKKTEEKEEHAKLLRLAERINGKKGTYIKFYGEQFTE